MESVATHRHDTAHTRSHTHCTRSACLSSSTLHVGCATPHTEMELSLHPYTLSQTVRVAVRTASRVGTQSHQKQPVLLDWTTTTNVCDHIGLLSKSTVHGLPAAVGLTSAALLVLKISSIPGTWLGWGTHCHWTVTGERRHVVDGSAWHRWIERTTGSAGGVTSGLTASLYVGALGKTCKAPPRCQTLFCYSAGKGYRGLNRQFRADSGLTSVGGS